MTDNKENRKSFEEFIAETVERQYSMDAPKTITPQELEERLQKRKAQRRMRRLKTVGFAAIFVIAVICTSIGFNTLTTNVGADKNDKEEIRTEDGVVIEDGGYGGSSEDKVVITEWDDIETIKFTNEKLMVPNYVPEDYKFESLTIEFLEKQHIVCEYVFINEEYDNILKIEVIIPNGGESYFEVSDFSKKMDSLKGVVYIYNENVKRAIIQIEDGIIIKLKGLISDEEIIGIINEMDY